MKKGIILISIWLITNNKVNAQHTDLAPYSIINDIRCFIDTVKPMSIYNGKFNVYVIKVSHDGYQNNPKKTCLTICYIKNDIGLKYINIDSYFMVDSEIVLLKASDIKESNLSNEIDIIKIDDNNFENVILRKIANSRIHGTPKSEVICFENGKKSSETFYFNSDEMPASQSIFDVQKIMEGVIIRKVPYPDVPPKEDN